MSEESEELKPGWNSAIMGQVVKVTPRWVVAVVPMIYNDRVTLASREDGRWRREYVAGFCYDKGGAAGLAALAWNPEKERDPVGFKKRACDSRPPGPGESEEESGE